MSRKRDKPYTNRHTPARISKRRRPWAPPLSEHDEIIDKPITKPPPPPALVVTGLPANCSVLELKSRFEIYGSISRIRIDKDGFGSVSYRTNESAEAAIAGSHEPSFGISIDSKKLEVVWATDPLVKWREGVTVGEGKDKTLSSSSSSKLLRSVMPLRKHGRSSRLASAIVNQRSHNSSGTSLFPATIRELKQRNIVAYDDIL
ncbi:RNA recognition motif domain [Arabidopsis thaliana x Arabidopsis arenosa]|uniref:RNA recognition motif domain n=1 Tax=Arabidopsis thaliana x Arabidopsis arenosa TaxID=1240361 RepID=A0A8T2CBV5_9BRAS|nr:RNA recognition motif domain [Arabidopsis thaliana x Arabidopsis arenosa]